MVKRCIKYGNALRKLFKQRYLIINKLNNKHYEQSDEARTFYFSA